MGGAAPLRAAAALGQHVWLVLALNFLASFAYHTMSVLLVLYATDEFGLGDMEAGLLYSWWGVLSSLWAGALCFVIDVTGVKRSAVMGMLIICCSRAVILSTSSVSILRLVLLGVSPLAEGLLAPVYMVGIKQLTREEQRALAYGLNYAVHNAGGGFADVAIDVLRGQYRADPVGFQGRLGGMVATPARACLLLSELALLLGLLLACGLPDSLAPPLGKACQTYRRFYDEQDEAAPADPGDVGHGQESPDPLEQVGAPVLREAGAAAPGGGAGCCAALAAAVRDRLELLRSRNLLAVATISCCLVGTKAQWHHMNATMPKYLVRELGEDTPWGSINSINYWTCSLLPPVAAVLTGSWREMPCIILGSFVMGVAPAFMVLETSVRATCAWLLLMSLGEVIWSPRFVTYTANLSPPGREGAFLVLANTPQFLAGLPTGWMSGKLLEQYCPDCPECRDPDTGSFCRTDCSGAAACGGELLAGARACAPREGGGGCLARDWAAVGRCPSSCAECPGWAGREDGASLWLWVLALALVGPALLLCLRRWLTQGMGEARRREVSKGAREPAGAGAGGPPRPDVIGGSRC